MGSKLQVLCNDIDTAVSSSRTVFTRFLGSRLAPPPVGTTLKTAFRGRKVDYLGKVTKQQQTLADHAGPVVILTPRGQTQYIFERQNGRWQGYRTTGGTPLPAGVSPLEQLDEELGRDPGRQFFVYSIGTPSGPSRGDGNDDSSAPLVFAPDNGSHPHADGTKHPGEMAQRYA